MPAGMAPREARSAHRDQDHEVHGTGQLGDAGKAHCVLPLRAPEDDVSSSDSCCSMVQAPELGLDVGGALSARSEAKHDGSSVWKAIIEIVSFRPYRQQLLRLKFLAGSAKL